MEQITLQVKNTKLEALVINSVRNWLKRNNFIEMFPPKIVKASGACENIDTLFEVGVGGNIHWFGNQKRHRAYLSQTAQLYLEAFTPYLDKVYTIGPSFRAEPKIDNRRLTEFQMVEVEFRGDFNNLLECVEGIIYKIISDILTLDKNSLKEIGLNPKCVRRLKKIKIPFPRLRYEQALKILDIEFGRDISKINEEKLIERFKGPFFITHFPNPLFPYKQIIEVEKFFNMLPDPQNPKFVLSADLILPYGGEAAGCAQRVDSYKEIKQRLARSKMFKRLKEKGGNLSDFSWYLNRAKQKIVPHSGGGIGLARVLKFIRGEEDIRKVITFPQNRANLI